jgi:HSP20 family protein
VLDVDHIHSREKVNDVTALVNRGYSSLVSEMRNWFGAAAPEPQIRLEEYVEGDRYVIRADIPGVDPEKDLEVTVEGNMLRLHGERREEKHDRRRTEIRYGTFERVLTLPLGTKPDDIQADYVDGVLIVSAPATHSAEPQAIPVTHRELPTE